MESMGMGESTESVPAGGMKDESMDSMPAGGMKGAEGETPEP
jgi:hypothetical protein